MGRKKASDQNKLLKHTLTIRVGEGTLERLEQLLKESSCRSIGEVARKILTKGRINLFHRDASLAEPMEELVLIRKELKSIGVNINQQTRYFNACKSEAEKNFHSERTVELYLKADAKMDRLFTIISKLTQKWLPRS